MCIADEDAVGPLLAAFRKMIVGSEDLGDRSKLSRRQWHIVFGRDRDAAVPVNANFIDKFPKGRCVCAIDHHIRLTAMAIAARDERQAYRWKFATPVACDEMVEKLDTDVQLVPSHS